MAPETPIIMLLCVKSLVKGVSFYLYGKLLPHNAWLLLIAIFVTQKKYIFKIMLTVFVLMGLGVMAGLFIRGKKIVAITVDKAVITCIFLLLFFMGLSIGSNETLLNALPKLGMNAILLTIGAIAGSVTVSYIVWKWFFDSPKNGMNNEN